MINLKRLAASATVAVLTLGMAFVAQPEQKASAGTPAGFYVCNESGEPLKVSLAYYNSDGTWTTQGVVELNQEVGSCQQIRNSLYNTRYYLYATTASGHVWKGNHPFCFSSLSYPTSNATNIGSCGRYSDESVGNFFSVWIPDPVTGDYPSYYGYTFAPNNYVINWNSPRAER